MENDNNIEENNNSKNKKKSKKNHKSEKNNKNNLDSNTNTFKLDPSPNILNTSIVLKILLLGNGSVGKTSLINRYLKNVYNPVYLTTIGIDQSIKYLVINNKHIKLSIWDTAGQEQFRTIAKSFYNKTDAVILCFDLTEKESLNSIGYWIDQLCSRIELNQIGLVLVGTKLDLAELEREENQGKEEEISEEVEKYVKKYNIKYFKTSSLNGTNVKEVFNYLVKITLNIKKFKEFENDKKDEEGNTIFDLVELDNEESKKINEKSLMLKNNSKLKSNIKNKRNCC
jgi:small GTP-binding protein